eukprot:TRINITY_DN1254_c0_g3_i2.p1 TRINITY_DN1254_c0_g3~~TRINITY_DN1254_c0_g3_i2.p1  ORF type:complete len:461 (-),score=92.51 TRINITY_DN1254_c0_g3_i2:119-1501(-)
MTIRKKALVNWLKNEKLIQKSVIIYVNFQWAADSLSSYLKTQGFKSVESYHAGKSPSERKRIQVEFLEDKIDIMVATVAFGMGLDKPNIRGIAHFHMPRSVENYVQEIGRAGRDGLDSHTHLFLDEEDYITLRSLSHSDTHDRANIKEFLINIFKRPKGNIDRSAGYDCVIPTNIIEENLDMNESIMRTILTWLHLDEYIQILPDSFSSAVLTFYSVHPEELRTKYTFFNHALNHSKHKDGNYTISLDELASYLGTGVKQVIEDLDSYQKQGLVSYLLKIPAFHFQIEQHPDDFDKLITDTHHRLCEQHHNVLYKLNWMFQAASKSCLSQALDKFQLHEINPQEMQEKEKIFQDMVNSYFSDETESMPDVKLIRNLPLTTETLTEKIRDFMSIVPEQLKCGRQVAKVFHGISSPCFQSRDWQYSKQGFWACARYNDFDDLVKLANRTIIEKKTQGLLTTT